MPRALICDFDGVILDSEPAHELAIRLAFEREGVGIEPTSPSDWNNYIGRGDRECIIDLAAKSGRPLTASEIARILAFKSEAFQSEPCQRLIRPFDATLKLMTEAAKLMPVAVASGSSRETVHRGLERFGLIPILSAIVTCDEVTRNKPDPEPYLAAATLLRVDPAHCTALEDSPTGITSAKAAGIYTIAVEHSFEASALNHADEIFRSSAEIPFERLTRGALR